MSRVDIDRPGVTYTTDTLRDIRAQYPDAELFFITGADAVAEIMQWKDANKMWELAHFVAVTRPGYSSPDGVKLPEGKVDTLEIPALAISSTDVRRRAEHGEPVWYLVPMAWCNTSANTAYTDRRWMGPSAWPPEHTGSVRSARPVSMGHIHFARTDVWRHGERNP